VAQELLERREALFLTVDNPIIPAFSCMPKTHKPGNKVRPVISSVNTPTSKICNFLVKKFREFKRPISRSVKNSLELIEKLKQEEIGEDEMMISFDIEALFPSIPMEEATLLLREWICDQDIPDKVVMMVSGLVEIALGQRWLQFEDRVLEQMDGTFIGNGLSSIITEVFLGDLEFKMEDKSWFPRVWYRYVDDVFAIIKRGDADKVVEQLNKRHCAIKFTYEEENNGRLPFLDTIVIRNNNKLEFDIYRKPTDAPLCIPSDSHHPMVHKLAAFESALFRMHAFPLTTARRNKELDYLLKMAEMNGFDKEVVLKLNEKHERKRKWRDLCRLQPIREEKKRKVKDRNGKDVVKNVVIPYFSPVTGRLQNALKCQSLNVCYKNRGNMKELIGGIKKIRSPLEKSGIYKIVCKNCWKIYYGQTKRRRDEREKEHDRAIRNQTPDLSAVAAHCLEMGHSRGPCKVIKEVNNGWELDAWESLYIMNEDEEKLMNVGEPPINSKLFKFARKTN
jgi:hypothetical protein